MTKFLKSVYQKLASYCAYQERCIRDVQERMKKYELNTEEQAILITQLQVDKFLSESRFAQSFTRGKFRGNGWGKQKIRYALQQKGISSKDIYSGLAEITDEEYYTRLEELLQKKLAQLKPSLNENERKKRLLNFARQKGYESDLIWELIRSLEQEGSL